MRDPNQPGVDALFLHVYAMTPEAYKGLLYNIFRIVAVVHAVEGVAEDTVTA